MEPEPPEVAGGKHPGCSFGRCFCCWIRSCSPRIPPVAPGRDYDRVPLGADDRAAWSVLVGFLPPSSAGTTSLLRLRRFRVARLGRVLGRSDDALENLDDVDYDAKGQSAQISAAAATPSTDGRSLKLCLFCLDFGVPGGSRFEPSPRPMEILLDLNAGRRISLHSLPHLPPRPFMPILTISAAGDLWAPGLFLNHDGTRSLVMQRLDKESEQWVQVSTMEKTHCDICYIYGYAVVRDTILLSLKPQHLFVVFNCTTCAWSAVKNENSFPTFTSTLGEYVTHYIPICGRGMYVEDDDTIYFLSKSIIYAYKLCQDQDQCQYQMALPTIVDRLCPFSDKGSGFLTHLGGRVMCFIWISVPSCGSQLCCNCDTSHVLITTFRVIGNSGNLEHFIPKGVQVLHSTCRRLDIDPSKSSASDYTFCFLQEYEENAMPPAKKKRENEMAPSMSLDLMEVTASSNVVQSFKMLTCCRDFFNQSHFLRALRLEKSVIQTTTDLYLICQAPSYSTVFKINIIDGRLACLNQNLTPHGMMDTFVCSDPDYLMEQPLPWHFICDSTSIFAVPDKMDNIHVLNLAEGTRDSFEATRPVGIDFSIALALRVGCNVIALSDTLECVYRLSDANQWVGHSIQGSVELGKKVELSGYVVLGARSFMVRDAKTSCCLLFDLDEDKWSIVRAYSDVSDSPPTGRSARAFLKGKSVFVGGFIYTCADGGLEAYEMIQVQDQYYLGKRISLEFPWCKYWDRNTMCFDYVGQDTTSGAVMFSAVQGGNYIHRPGAPHKHPVLITTIQVKTERTSRGTLKPVAVSHVNAGTSFIGLDLGPIWTCSCFALSRMKE